MGAVNSEDIAVTVAAAESPLAPAVDVDVVVVVNLALVTQYCKRRQETRKKNSKKR